MEFRIYRPSHPGLQACVRFIAFIEVPAGTEDTYLCLFPNCTTNLSINLDEPVRIGPYKALQNFASTSCLSPVAFDRSVRIRMINIQFEPFGLFALLGIPMQQLRNRLSSLDQLFRASALEALYNQIADAKNDTDIRKTIEQFLWQRLDPDAADPRIRRGVLGIREVPGLRMDDLSRMLNLSSRGLRKRFAQQVGISPKFYARLARFNRAALQIAQQPATSLTAIAADQGYFDQAHFIKEFRAFGGITPGRFQELPHKGSDFYNFEHPGPVTFGMT